MEGPRERLARLGVGALADIELLAVLLGTGRVGENVSSLAASVLRRTGSLGALARLTPTELAQIAGIGPAKAARLAAAFEAGARALVPREVAAPLTNSEIVFKRYGRALMSSPVERFLVLSVDAKNRPRLEREVARGGRSSCQVDLAEVFRILIADSASGAVFVHNHPSGDPEPSAQDLALTERLVTAGTLFEIRILDHVIVGSGRYTSLRDAGMWPTT